MNQRMVMNKPLYVALAQRKDVRRSQLEQQIHARNQMRMQNAAAAGMPGQFIPPMFYGQQPGFFQGNGRNNGPFPGPNPQMMMPRGQIPPPQANGQELVLTVNQSQCTVCHQFTVTSTVLTVVNKEVTSLTNVTKKGGRQAKDLAAIIASAPEDQHKRILGEELYPKIVATGKAQEPEAAGKITGMMLDLDNEEILALLDNDDLFNNHFEDALTAYEEYKKSEEAQA